MENKEIENLEEIVKEDNKSKKKLELKHKIIYRLIFYICAFIYSLIISLTNKELNVVLGDFGSITTILMQIVSIYGFRWMCVCSVIGIILTFLKEKFEDVNRVYTAVIIVVLLGSSIFYFMG